MEVKIWPNRLHIEYCVEWYFHFQMLLTFESTWLPKRCSIIINSSIIMILTFLNHWCSFFESKITFSWWNWTINETYFCFEAWWSEQSNKKRRTPHYVFDRFHGHINTHRFSTQCSLSYFVLRFVDIVFAYCFVAVIFVSSLSLWKSSLIILN